MAEKRRWVNVRQLLSGGVWERREPTLHSAVMKLVASEDFDQPVTIQPDEAKAVLKLIHGFLNRP